jgi:hypothetical protein
MKQFFIVVALILVSGIAMAQRQGICGKVEWAEGNQMPGVNKKNAVVGVEREIHIYKPVNRKSLRMRDGLYPEISGQLIKVVKSSPDGTFTVKLPAGDYSVFVKEPSGFFANIFAGDGTLNPVTVKKREFVVFKITVNYKAVY